MMQLREEKMQVLKNILPKQLQQSFTNYMRYRNYDGNLRVDHINRQINISVRVQDFVQRDPQAVDDGSQTVGPNRQQKKRELQDLKGSF